MVVVLIILTSILYLITTYYTAHRYKNSNASSPSVPYEKDYFCMSLVCENCIFILSFNEQNTKFYYLNSQENKNQNFVIDNINLIAKNKLDLNLSKHCELSNSNCEEIINSCGGISILNENGEENFVIGKQFAEILQNSTNYEYKSYIFAILLKTIFDEEMYSYLYKFSNVSYIDIVNHSEKIKKSLNEIICLNCEV